MRNFLSGFFILYFVLPSKLANYDIRQFAKGEGLKIGFDRNSPPMAIVEDAFLIYKEPSRETIKLEGPPPQSKARNLSGIRLSKTEAALPTEKMATVVVAALQEKSMPSLETRDPNELLKQIFTQIKSGTTNERQVALNAQPSTTTLYSTKPSEPKNTSPQATSVVHANSTNNPVEISGNIQLSGLSYTGQETFSIFRELDGKVKEQARVSINDAKFDMNVTEQRGYLIAEMKSSSGKILGRADVWLDPIAQKNGKAIVPLDIEPVASVAAASSFLSGRVTSPYAVGSVTDPVVNARILYASSMAPVISNKQGRFELLGTHPESSLILRSRKKGYWNSVVLTTGRSRQPIVMYPEKMVRALYENVGRTAGVTEKDFESSGIVWGKIVHNDEPLAGANVELAESGAVGPIYFNALMLPDPNLRSTSENGVFVFLNVNPGVNVIRASVSGKVLPSKVLPVDARHVSNVVIDISSKVAAEVISFDAFSKQPVTSRIRFSGTSKSVQTNANGAVKLNYSNGPDPIFLESDPGEEYLSVRGVYGRVAGKELGLPTFTRSWFDSMKINRSPGTGVIVGFVDGKKFDVFSDGEGQGHPETYYFNSHGDIVNAPVADGGFIIFNLPLGMRQISIVPEGSDVIYHQVVPLDDEYTGVIFQQFK